MLPPSSRSLDALQQQAMAKYNQLRAVRELKRVDAALHRINAGVFGFCVDCDQAIKPK